MREYIQKTVTVMHPEKGEAYACVASIKPMPDAYYLEKARPSLAKLADGFDWSTIKIHDTPSARP